LRHGAAERQRGGTVTEVFALLAAVLLLAGNAFFVGAEFALISARRDRLDTLAAGTGRTAPAARTVLRAYGRLPQMLAASQLAITVCSLLLGRLGEPAVARLLERPIRLVGLSPAAVAPIALVVALLLVVVAHMLLGEMVPRNIALAGPEQAAMLLVPPFLLFTAAVGPIVTLFNRLAQVVLRLLRVRPRDELEEAFTLGELAVMIAESRREGLLDDAESVRLTRTLQAADATVADVLVPRDELVSLPPQPRVGDVTAAVAATGFSRFPVLSPARESWVGYLHVKDVLDLIDGEAATVPPQRVRGLPEVASTARLDHAVTVLRASRAHLARAVDPAGATVGLVALEDLVEVFVGTVRDATHRQG
jgi:CBS domain containing-hemolysin-like protein